MAFPIDNPGAPPPAVPPAEGWRWIPIRSLAPRHRPRILAHLLAQNDSDRHLRFGHVASDAQVGRYVDHIDFDHDEVFGVFNRRLELVAMAHLAYLGPDSRNPSAAEFGVSVNAPARGRGMGSRLFDHAVLRARNRHVDTLVIHALAENAGMLRIVRQAGATIVRDGPDTTARLGLPPEDIASHAEALAVHQAAEFDYGIKVHAQRIGGMLRLLTPWQA